MNTIGVRELQKRIRECVEASQAENTVITRNGKPASIVIGVEGYNAGCAHNLSWAIPERVHRAGCGTSNIQH